MTVKDFQNQGYSQIALSQLSGTGGIQVTALEKRIDNQKIVQLVIEGSHLKKPKNLEINLNEVTTIAHVLEDIIYLNKLK